MRILQKGDPEYISNGHFNVEGEDMMSIWTYKIKNGIKPNDHETNSSDSTMMASKYEYGDCVPDKGGFGTVHIFNVTDLNEYFSQ